MKIKRALKLKGENVGNYAAKHARYTQTSVFVPQTEDNDNAGWYKVSRNEDINLLDAWVTEANGFDGRDLRAATRCRDLWDCMPRPTHRLSEQENDRHARAATTLQTLKRQVPRRDWDTFENAMRWNEPGGYSGSRFLEPRQSRVADTRNTVKRVLQAIAR